MIRKPLHELQERKSFYCNGSTLLLLLNDGRIASSEFEIIQIYDINKLNQLVMSIPIHTIEFNKMYELDDNILISFPILTLSVVGKSTKHLMSLFFVKIKMKK